MSDINVEPVLHKNCDVVVFNENQLSLTLEYNSFSKTNSIYITDSSLTKRLISTIPDIPINDVMFVVADVLYIYYSQGDAVFVILEINSTFDVVNKMTQTFMGVGGAYTRCLYLNGAFIVCGVTVSLQENTTFYRSHASDNLALLSDFSGELHPTEEYSTRRDNLNLSLFVGNDEVWMQFKNTINNIVTSKINIDEQGQLSVVESYYTIEYDSMGYHYGLYDVDYDAVITIFSEETPGAIYAHQQPVFKKHFNREAKEGASLIQVNLISGSYLRPYIVISNNNYYAGWEGEGRLTTNTIDRASFLPTKNESYFISESPAQFLFTVSLLTLTGSYVSHTTNDNLWGTSVDTHNSEIR